jgi:hypothetical protein
VEAVRIGTLIAQDRKALAAWRRHLAKLEPQRSSGAGLRGSGGGGLAGAELERAVMGLRITNGDIVAVRTAAGR